MKKIGILATSLLISLLFSISALAAEVEPIDSVNKVSEVVTANSGVITPRATTYVDFTGELSSNKYGYFTTNHNCNVRVVVAAQYINGNTTPVTVKVGSKTFSVTPDGVGRVLGTVYLNSGYPCIWSIENVQQGLVIALNVYEY